MRRCEVKVHIRNAGTQDHYDITNAIGDIKITSSTNSPSKTLTSKIFTERVSKANKTFRPGQGSTFCMYIRYDDTEEFKEIYRGSLVTLSSSESGVSEITVKDALFNLSKCKISRNMIDVDVYSTIKALIKEHRVEYGYISEKLKGVKVTRYFRNVEVLKVIQTLLTLAEEKINNKDKKENEKTKFELETRVNKVSVQNRGYALKVEYNCKNMSGLNQSYDSENIVNSVSLYDKDGNLLSIKENKGLIDYYNRLARDSGTEEDPAKLVESMEKEIEVSGIGNWDCQCGAKVHLSESLNAPIADFYIDKVTHHFYGGLHETTMQLNFLNISNEEKAGQEDDPNKKEENPIDALNVNCGTVTAGASFNHGVTAEHLNRVLKGVLKGKGHLILKWCNAYKIHPALWAGICYQESGGGTSKMATDGRNQFLGIIGYWNSSVEEGIIQGASLLSRRYVGGRGFKKLSQFVGVYCTSGCGGWADGVRRAGIQVCGKNLDNVYWGPGGVSDAQARQNLTIGGMDSSSCVVTSGNGHYSSNTQQRICQIANDIGPKTVYLWGGRGTGNRYRTDCSGFVSRVLWEANVAEKGKIRGGTTSTLKSYGKTIPISQAQAGDVVVCRSSASGSGWHTFLLMGNGKCWNNGGGNGVRATFQKPYWGPGAVIKRYW
jgi:hypothetical protein